MTGAAGLVGGNLSLLWAEQFPVVAVCHRHVIRHDRLQVVQANLERESEVREVLALNDPAVVVHCAAATDVDRCEAEPASAWTANVESTQHIARWAAKAGARLIYISTDAVFNGRGGPYDEEQEPAPPNVYARTKLQGEQVALSVCPGAVILRLNPYGWSPSGTRSLVEWFLNRLRQGVRTPGFRDVLFSPLLVTTLADLIPVLLSGGATGVYHVASAEGISKHEFGRLTAEAFLLDPELVEPVSVAEQRLRAERPLDTRLIAARLVRERQWRPPSIRTQLAELRKLELQGHREKLQAMLAA